MRLARLAQFLTVCIVQMLSYSKSLSLAFIKSHFIKFAIDTALQLKYKNVHTLATWAKIGIKGGFEKKSFEMPGMCTNGSAVNC